MYAVELHQQEVYRIQDPIDLVEVKLLEGSAEIFGKELLIKHQYEFEAHQPFSIFTWYGAKLQIKYKENMEQPGYVIDEEDQPYSKMMQKILKINYILESQRQNSMRFTSCIGPRVMVIGSKSSGKNSLCKILLNYSVIYGWNPIYCDLDPDQQGNEYPGTIRAEIYSANIDEKSTKLSYFYGYTYQEQMKDKNYQLLYQKLVDQLGNQVIMKLDMDLKKCQEQKKQFIQQYQQIQDQKLCEMIYNKYQEDRDQKDIYASGLILNCPTQWGTHSQMVEQIKNMIENYSITFVVVIDLPDVFRDLERSTENTQVLVYKLEKLRGVVNQNIYDTENQWKQRLQSVFQSSHRIAESQFYLYELQLRDDKQIIYQRSKQNKIVRLVIGVLHLKKNTLIQIEEDKSLSDIQKECKVSEQIFQSPLAFLAYIDDYKSGSFSIQIPNDQCLALLQNNVCLFGRMNN